MHILRVRKKSNTKNRDWIFLSLIQATSDVKFVDIIKGYIQRNQNGKDRVGIISIDDM